jgi:Lrp/AsnC family transcriptional regulator, leucine-responsive regulatory protein
LAEEYSESRATTRPLEEIDTALLLALQGEGRMRLEDLARRVGLAPSSVHDRLRRLQRDGVIRKWTISVAPEALGLAVLAFVGVRASKPCSELVEPLGAIGEIEEMHSVAGQFSMLLKLRAPSTERLLEIIERIKRVPGVQDTETTIALKSFLERGPRPAR